MIRPNYTYHKLILFWTKFFELKKFTYADKNTVNLKE